MTAPRPHAYKATETKYKGGAKDMYVTYDISQMTRGGREATYHKVKRVYIAGTVKTWHLGTFTNRAGRPVHGIKIEYEQRRAGYSRRPYGATRGRTTYRVSPARVSRGASTFSKIVEVPSAARNIRFHRGQLPRQYLGALQAVR